ncbi:MAG: PAS domain S-box protein [Myxococcaceae bacterium]|nr:MAG: PAS domain S-box protein [Myxococcaceae bacterium]
MIPHGASMDDEQYHRRSLVGVGRRARVKPRRTWRSRYAELPEVPYRAIVEASPILTAALDHDGKVRLVNRAMEQSVGLPRAALVGRYFDELLSPAGPELEALSPEAPIERGLVTNRGTERRVQWRVVAAEHLRWVFGVDVTEARAAERRLRVVEQLAVVGDLTTGLAHEIRNPLNSALLELKVLARRLARAESAADQVSVEAVRSELGRIERLLADFLWFARPGSSTTQPGQLSSPAEAVARLVSAEVAARSIVLTTEFDPSAAPVAFDEDSVRQVIFNLVRNAIEAVGDGGHIVLRVRAGVRTTELDVVDNGPGIQGDPARVFVPFHTTKPLGTGLGLTIAQRIAIDQGGEVRVHSSPGRTVFTFVLPALREPGGERIAP